MKTKLFSIIAALAALLLLCAGCSPRDGYVFTTLISTDAPYELYRYSGSGGEITRELWFSCGERFVFTCQDDTVYICREDGGGVYSFLRLSAEHGGEPEYILERCDLGHSLFNSDRLFTHEGGYFYFVLFPSGGLNTPTLARLDETGQTELELLGPCSLGTAWTYSISGGRIYTGAWDSGALNVYEYNLDSGELLTESSLSGPFEAAAFCGNRLYLQSGSVKVLELSPGLGLCELGSPDVSPRSLTYISPYDGGFVYCADDGTVYTCGEKDTAAFWQDPMLPEEEANEICAYFGKNLFAVTYYGWGDTQTFVGDRSSGKWKQFNHD